MAKAPVAVAKNKKGQEKKEYPKLVKTKNGKVRVNSEEEEDAIKDKLSDSDTDKPAGWAKK